MGCVYAMVKRKKRKVPGPVCRESLLWERKSTAEGMMLMTGSTDWSIINPGTSAGFWLGGQCPFAAWGNFFLKIWKCNINIENCSFCMFNSLYNFSSIFPGGQLTQFAPMYGRPCINRKKQHDYTHFLVLLATPFVAEEWCGLSDGRLGCHHEPYRVWHFQH